jgi:hypothetical protein
MSNETISITCPHCKGASIIEKRDIHGGIFRHMVYKKNNKQVSPETSQKICDDLIKRKQVDGCSKPFIICKQDEGSYSVIKCGYI